MINEKKRNKNKHDKFFVNNKKKTEFFLKRKNLKKTFNSKNIYKEGKKKIRISYFTHQVFHRWQQRNILLVLLNIIPLQT